MDYIKYYKFVKTVSIQDLKRRLSSLLAETAGGERVLITRHRRPIATLVPAGTEHLHTGSRFGRASLRPLRSRPGLRRYLEVLLDDRRAGREEK